MCNLSRLVFQVGFTLVGLAGCSQKPAPPPVFGGQGATVTAAKETPLPAESEKGKAQAGPCGGVSPASDAPLIDDFEDGDSKPFKAFQREGWWSSASDNTDGSKISPSGSFAPDRLPSVQATKSNIYAAHLTAQGQKQWGATWGTTFRWVEKGIRCPFNASGFAGIKFRAKGPGDIRVNFGIPDTVPRDDGGTCTERCWDSHGMSVHLTDRWDDYIVRWDRVQQGGWGTDARFDPTRLLGLNFSVSTKDLPADFWVDDIEFISSQQANAPAAAPPEPGKPAKAPKGR